MATDMNPLMSLDARYYTDPAIFEIESRDLFASSWQFAGHASQLQRPGDYFTFEMAGESLFCVMDRDGAINAFYNFYQNRANQLVQGSGRVNVLTCLITPGVMTLAASSAPDRTSRLSKDSAARISA